MCVHNAGMQAKHPLSAHTKNNASDLKSSIWVGILTSRSELDSPSFVVTHVRIEIEKTLVKRAPTPGRRRSCPIQPTPPYDSKDVYIKATAPAALPAVAPCLPKPFISAFV